MGRGTLAGAVFGAPALGQPVAAVPAVAGGVVVVAGLVLFELVPFLAGLERVRMLRTVRRRFDATMGDGRESWEEAERLVRMSRDLARELEHRIDDSGDECDEDVG